MRRTQCHPSVAGRCSLALVATVGVWAHEALAEEPTRARLAYERGALAQHCPSEAGLRDQVSARLGRVPFSDDAQLELRAKIERQGAFLIATLTAEDGSGSPAIRELRSPEDDCEELARALALAISVAIDPMTLMRPSEPAPEPTTVSGEETAVPTPSVEPPEAEPATTEPAAPEPEPVFVKPAANVASPLDEPLPAKGPRTRTGAGPYFAAAPGALPALALGGGLRGQLDVPDIVRLGVQAEWSGAPTLVTDGGAEVSASFWFGRAFVCHAARWVAFCAQGGAGRIVAEGHAVDQPRRDRAWHATLGLRVEATHDLGEAAAIWLALDGDASLTPVVFEVSDRGVWQSPRFFPRLAAGVLLLP